MSNQQYLKELQLLHTKEQVIINGLVIPLIAVIVLITNMFVILVYVKQYKQTQYKVRKISSILYVSIATANTLSVVPTSIWNFYFYLYRHRTKYAPYHICWTRNFFMAFNLVPHMASIWFVTLLSIQRFMVIRYPFSSVKHWTIKRMYIMVTFIWIVMLTLQIPHVLNTTIISNSTLTDTTTNESIATGCVAQYAEWLGDNGEMTEIVSYAIKLIGIVIIPSILIIYSDASLVIFLRQSAIIRKTLGMSHVNVEIKDLVQSDKPQSKSESPNLENHHQTLLVVILSSVVFVVEIPYSVLLVVFIYFISIQDYDMIRWLWIGPVINITHLTVFVSYPALFILSCLFSRQFRKLLLNMFQTKRNVQPNCNALDTSPCQEP